VQNKTFRLFINSTRPKETCRKYWDKITVLAELLEKQEVVSENEL